MSTKQYELVYFNGRGRGEISRLIFAAAGVEYEDVRYEEDETWPEVKKTLVDLLPFDQLPLLKVEGVVLCQSLAIARFLAKKFGLVGQTELEQARTDMIVYCLEDTASPIIDFAFYEPDSARQAEKKKKYTDEQLPKCLSNLEKILKQNNGGDGYFVGDALTWPDLLLVNLVDWLAFVELGSHFPKYEKLNALYQRVTALPKVAEWLEKRPKTPW